MTLTDNTLYPAPPRPGPVTTLATLTALTRSEMRRYARHPLFLVGVGLTALSCYFVLRHTVADAGGLPGYPATFLGVFGIIIGFRLSQSLHGADDALDVAPACPQLRTAALCLAALVPFVAGLVTLIAIMRYQHPAGPWTYGTFDGSDRFAMLFGELAVSALGGPLLGIAVAGWIRSAWIVPLIAAGIYVWAGLVNGLTNGRENSFGFVLLRMFTPYTYFVSENGDGSVVTWRGSPWFFLGWQLGLCALAVTVALLRGAAPPARKRLLTVLAVAAAAAGTLYFLAATGGLTHAVISYPGVTDQPR